MNSTEFNDAENLCPLVSAELSLLPMPSKQTSMPRNIPQRMEIGLMRRKSF